MGDLVDRNLFSSEPSWVLGPGVWGGGVQSGAAHVLGGDGEEFQQEECLNKDETELSLWSIWTSKLSVRVVLLDQGLWLEQEAALQLF